MVLELVHEHCAITSHLLVTINGQEGDLCEALLWVSAVADAADDSVLPQNSQGGMPIVEDQPHDVIFGHFWQLTREYVLQGDQLSARNVGTIIDYGLEVYIRQCGGIHHWVQWRAKAVIHYVLLLETTRSIAYF